MSNHQNGDKNVSILQAHGTFVTMPLLQQSGNVIYKNITNFKELFKLNVT